MTAQRVETPLVPAQAVPADRLLVVQWHERRPVGLYERRLKRVLDVLVAGFLLVLELPVLAVVAAAVMLDLGRPVLFRQERVGKDGRTFFVYKFRTMRQDRRHGERRQGWRGQDRRQTHKSENDPRHTRVGRILRRTSLDELPQLWNVLRGDMSLVGPRPELVSVVARYADWQHARHVVRPGLTGLWQISARGHRPMHEATDIDLEYVARLSAREDLRILLATPLVILRGTGS